MPYRARMHSIRTLTFLLTIATAATAGAQTLTLIDTNGPRASLRVGRSGDSLDWDASIDSPVIGDIVRFRGSVGQGRWASEFASYPDPKVARLAFSALVFLRTSNPVRPYIGLGTAAYLPRGPGWSTHRGMRIVAGMEGSGERWTIGVEVEADLPRPRDLSRPLPTNALLYPDGRIGIAVRRHF